MELVCKKRFEDEVGATFTLNKKYKFQFESNDVDKIIPSDNTSSMFTIMTAFP